jgi:hypothetical protein
MERICPKCAKDPLCHSFKKVADKNGLIIFFTHPSKSKLYDDSDGMIAHVDNMITAIGNKKWSCVIDGTGFDLKHAAEISMGQRMFDLFMKKHAATVHEIHIINPTWHIEGILKLVKSSMKPEMFAKVKVMDDRPRSVLEYI